MTVQRLRIILMRLIFGIAQTASSALQEVNFGFHLAGRKGKAMRRKKIGVKDFHGSVDITDPCYNKDVWCRMDDVRIKEGEYTCIAWYHTDKGEYNGKPYAYKMVGIIGIYLKGKIPRQKAMKEIGSIGVDAGLAGFFHNKPDYDDDAWSAFCDRVHQGNVWMTEDGFYSSSGYGDGWYGVYAKKQNGEIVALEIRFI